MKCWEQGGYIEFCDKPVDVRYAACVAEAEIASLVGGLAAQVESALQTRVVLAGRERWIAWK